MRSSRQITIFGSIALGRIHSFLLLASPALMLVAGGRLVAEQPAYRSEDFTDFVGINASPFDRFLDSGPYAGAGTKYPPDLFFELGIRYYRTGLFNDLVKPEGPALMKSVWEKHGVKPMLFIDPHKTTTAAAVLEKVKAFDPRVIAALEGPNELNNKFPPQELNLRYEGKTDEAAGCAFMDDVYAALRGDAQTENIPVVAYTAIFTDYRLARPHAGFDFANMHSYQGYDVPSSSLLMNETRANRFLPVGATIKPFVPTECGYNVEQDVSNGSLKTGSLRAQALNIPMLLAEYFRHGIKRTYFFALHNADGYGLLESDQETKRPSYFAVKNLLAIIRDASWNPQSLRWEGGDGFVPRALLFTIEGAPPTVHTLTLQKRSGEYLLLIWNELKNFDQDAKSDLYPPQVPVTLRFQSRVPSDGELLMQNDRGEFEPSAVKIENGVLHVNVPSAVMILRLASTSRPNEDTVVPARANVKGDATENSVRLAWDPVTLTDRAGYFVFRNGNHVATTRDVFFVDASEWIRPGLGYCYAVRAFDKDGNMSPLVETVVTTAAKFPDLVIAHVDVPVVHASEKVRFRASISNTGEGATPNNVIVGATFRVDGETISWGGHHGPPLQPGQTIEVVAGGGPKGTADWTATPGAHILQVKLDDVNRIPEEKEKANNDADRSLWVDVKASGLLLGESDAAPFETDLTREGTLDWVHWGLTGKDGVVRKADVAPEISDLREIGTGARDATPGFGMRAKWSDGDPVKTQPGTNAGLWLNGVGHGYEFSAPADENERVLKIFVGGIEGAACKLSAHLSDASAPDYVSTTWNGNAAFEWCPVPGGFTAVYSLRYRAASSEQRLVVRWVLDREPNRFLGQARLQAATLASP